MISTAHQTSADKNGSSDHDDGGADGENGKYTPEILKMENSLGDADASHSAERASVGLSGGTCPALASASASASASAPSVGKRRVPGAGSGVHYYLRRTTIPGKLKRLNPRNLLRGSSGGSTGGKYCQKSGRRAE